MFIYDKAIQLRNSRLTFDARRRSEICCISHAHTDHIRLHDFVYATAPTVAFMQARLGKKFRAQTATFGQAFEVEGYRISFHPAGHILGSAQILAEREGQRLLYTGDFKLETSATAEPLQVQPCDLLIMECTFGRPHFKFPPRAELVERLCEWVACALREGRVPIIHAYALGKAQEAIKVLTDNGFAPLVHRTIMPYVRLYEKFGQHLGEAELLRSDSEVAGKVLIAPHNAREERMLKRIINRKTMLLSGWAVDTGFKYRNRVDDALPFSDHADFPALLEFVRRVNPKKIFTTHGPQEFAVYLRGLGYNAQPLEGAKQGELF
ncbi:MAG: MBL fold metallo-hydrolase RNA specificity domain-containing protein [candidate division KSB1 bacterium]